MKDEDIDDALRRATGQSGPVDPALLSRITQSMAGSLTPVRPLPSARLMTALLWALCVGIALVGARLLGMHGIEKMSSADIAAIFPVLAALIWLAASSFSAEMVPGSRRPIRPWLLLVSGCGLVGGVFGLLFHDYSAERFVAQGTPCLTTGLAFAIPTAIAGWLLFRRGYAVNARDAGLVLGSISGLAGLALLEMHCANFEAPHLLVWHLGVPAIAGLAGWLVARMLRRR